MSTFIETLLAGTSDKAAVEHEPTASGQSESCIPEGCCKMTIQVTEPNCESKSLFVIRSPTNPKMTNRHYIIM